MGNLNESDKITAKIDFTELGETLEELINKQNKKSDNINHPSHYGGEDNPYEAIKVIEAWDLGFNLGNTLKYISRAGHKTDSSLSEDQKALEDLNKAAWYLNREIENRKVKLNDNKN